MLLKAGANPSPVNQVCIEFTYSFSNNFGGNFKVITRKYLNCYTIIDINYYCHLNCVKLNSILNKLNGNICAIMIV